MNSPIQRKRESEARRYGTTVELSQATERGKRDAEAKRSMTTPYSDPQKQEAYEKGYRTVRASQAGR